MTSSGLEARGLTKSYHQGNDLVPVLQGVDLVLAPGESLALLGASGTGKSTLLNILGGIEVPDAGVLAINDNLVGTTPAELDSHRRDRVAFIFQFFNLLPNLTVTENVLTGLEVRGPLPDDAVDRVRSALAAVGMETKSAAFPGELSGGQQQRVAIARALVKEAPLVLADEPTGNLDPHTSAQVLDVLFEQAAQPDTMLVVVTHDPQVASRAHRVARLIEGRLEEVHQ